MTEEPRGFTPKRERRPWLSAETKSDVKLVTSLLILALLGMSGVFYPGWRTTPAGEESLAGIADALFTKWVVAFEVLSALLLAALVGAVAIAAREEDA